METKAVRRRAPGVIRADESYTLREFLRRADIGDHAWRQIRRRIKLRRIGYKIYVLGRDWLDYLATVGEEGTEESGQPGRTDAGRRAG